MHTQCNSGPLRLEGLGRREVIGQFNAGRASSDGGAVLLRATNQVLDLTAARHHAEVRVNRPNARWAGRTANLLLTQAGDPVDTAADWSYIKGQLWPEEKMMKKLIAVAALVTITVIAQGCTYNKKQGERVFRDGGFLCKRGESSTKVTLTGERLVDAVNALGPIVNNSGSTNNGARGGDPQNQWSWLVQFLAAPNLKVADRKAIIDMLTNIYGSDGTPEQLKERLTLCRSFLNDGGG